MIALLKDRYLSYDSLKLFLISVSNFRIILYFLNIFIRDLRVTENYWGRKGIDLDCCRNTWRFLHHATDFYKLLVILNRSVQLLYFQALSNFYDVISPLNFSHPNSVFMLQSCTIKPYCSGAYWGSKHRHELPSISLLNIIRAEEDKCPAVVPWIMESCSAIYNWHMSVLSAK